MLYSVFYLVLSFLVHICYCSSQKMILLWLKNLVIIIIFYVLIYKKECFLANLEGVKVKHLFDPSAPTNSASLDTKWEKNWFFKKFQGFEILKLCNYFDKWIGFFHFLKYNYHFLGLNFTREHEWQLTFNTLATGINECSGRPHAEICINTYGSHYC